MLVLQILKTLAHFITQYQTIIIISSTWDLNGKIPRSYQARCDRFKFPKNVTFYFPLKGSSVDESPMRCLSVVLFNWSDGLASSLCKKHVINAQLWTITVFQSSFQINVMFHLKRCRSRLQFKSEQNALPEDLYQTAARRREASGRLPTSPLRILKR